MYVQLYQNGKHFLPAGAFLQISGSQMRPLPNSIRIVFIIWFMECCHLFKGHLSSLSNMSTENFVDIRPSKCRDFMGLLAGGISRSHSLFQVKANSNSHSEAWI